MMKGLAQLFEAIKVPLGTADVLTSGFNRRIQIKIIMVKSQRDDRY